MCELGRDGDHAVGREGLGASTSARVDREPSIARASSCRNCHLHAGAPAARVALQKMSDGYSDDDDEDLFAFNPDAAPAPKKRRKEIDVSLLKTSDTSLEAAAAEREASEAAVAEAARAAADEAAEAEAAEAAAARRREAEAAAAALPAADASGGAKFVKSARKPENETTRAKNRRKEKLGQAKFTLKEDRDCPSVWDGGAK